MIYRRMTWQELGDVDWAHTVALVPTGAMEQHGPHLPVDTDTLIVTRLAEEAEQRSPERVLLTPTVWLGHSPHHLSFGGTLSLFHPSYIQMLIGICRSLVGMGARRICLLNGHGGNRAPLAIALQELKNECRDTLVVSAEYWGLASAAINAARESGFGGLGHACELETSLYLYLNEPEVRKDRICDDGAGWPDDSFFRSEMMHGSAASRVMNFDELTRSGVYGRPTLATARKGETLFTAISDRIERFLQEVNAIGTE
ncbi:creatininase family protein [Paenibacillus cymbidii]|uniref:creatininase family protein n=1 Tax=Paenibacillus cymbidii TaxID=1639034 RepID=UPI00108042B7|nr:creatininase family protein [Paenibacillus cymbidii]